MRLHLFEFHEQFWLPSVLRRGVTDYLRAANELAGYDQLILPLLQKQLTNSGQTKILDLGSGAGGAWAGLLPALQAEREQPINLTLSDAHPRPDQWQPLQQAHPGQVDYLHEPTDARAVPAAATGLRTLFNLFHHFRPEDARAILADADAKRQPILIVETLDKSWLQGIMIVLLAPLLTLLLTPRIRPVKAWRFLFTYLIPILPLLIAWDGLVSVIRLHGNREIQAWTRELDGLQWGVGEVRQKGKVLRYVAGLPKASHQRPLSAAQAVKTGLSQ